MLNPSQKYLRKTFAKANFAKAKILRKVFAKLLTLRKTHRKTFAKAQNMKW